MHQEDWPLYPVALSGSSYFVIDAGIIIGASNPEDAASYLQYCRESGVFRTTQVPLPTRTQAVDDAAALRTSRAWKAIKWADKGPDFEYHYDESRAWEFVQKQAEGVP
jgi:hypothetical protein